MPYEPIRLLDRRVIMSVSACMKNDGITASMHYNLSWLELHKCRLYLHHWKLVGIKSALAAP